MRRALAERVVLDSSVLLGDLRTHVAAAAHLGYVDGFWSSWIVAEAIRVRTEWIARRAVQEGCGVAETMRRLDASRQQVNLLISELSRDPSQRLASDDVTFDGSPSRGRSGIDASSLNQFRRRYIFHLLARVTAYIEVASGKPDLFDKYVDRNITNPWDIEHIWADDYSRYSGDFASPQEFLVHALVNLVWSPERLKAVRQGAASGTWKSKPSGES